MKIGILALQGAFIEHEKMLARLDAETIQVRLPPQLADLDGLIIPGGESTTIGKLAVEYEILEPIKEFVTAGKPVWGICAGMIFLARDVGAHKQPLAGLMDVKVKRNAFGRQVDSFETNIEVPAFGDDCKFRAIFIRAPAIEETGNEVEVLARLPDGTIVAARQDNILVTAFHPELTDDLRFHRYFVQMSEA